MKHPLKNKWQQSVEFYMHGVKPTIEVYAPYYFRRLIARRIKYAICMKEHQIKNSKLSHKKIIFLLKKLEAIKNMKIG